MKVFVRLAHWSCFVTSCNVTFKTLYLTSFPPECQLISQDVKRWSEAYKRKHKHKHTQTSFVFSCVWHSWNVSMWLSDMFLFRTLLALTLTDWLRSFTMASCRIPEVRTSTEQLLEAKCIKHAMASNVACYNTWHCTTWQGLYHVCTSCVCVLVRFSCKILIDGMENIIQRSFRTRYHTVYLGH